jgi:hypothetical protein
MRKAMSTKMPHEQERDEAEQEEVQPMRHRTGEEEEEEIAEQDLADKDVADDAEDHTMEMLDEDDLANMQGPDA